MEYNEEDLGMMFDLRNIDFKVCKDLTKVICQNDFFFKLSSLPKWVKPGLFWYDPSDQTVLFGPEHIVELFLFLAPEHEISFDPSIELVAKKMTNLENLRLYFEPEAGSAIDSMAPLVPFLKGLKYCQSLQQLEIYCRPHSHLR